MAKEAGSGGMAGEGAGCDPAGRIALVGERTCLLAIDQMLAMLPGAGSVRTAAEAAGLARRVTRSAEDYRAAATGLPGIAGHGAPQSDVQ
jgi:hypothetical protein